MGFTGIIKILTTLFEIALMWGGLKIVGHAVKGNSSGVTTSGVGILVGVFVFALALDQAAQLGIGNAIIQAIK